MFALPVALPLDAAKMPGETGPQPVLVDDIGDRAIDLAANGLKDLIRARGPEGPITKTENDQIDTLVSIVLSVGFHRGRWLANAENAKGSIQRFDHHPHGYPT